MRCQFETLSQNIVVEIDPVQYSGDKIMLFGLIGIQCFMEIQQLGFLHGNNMILNVWFKIYKIK